MAGELTIEVTADGRATVRFPGGGQHTVGTTGGNTDEAISVLKSAYGNRIGNVVNTDKTLSQVSEEQKVERQSYRNKAVDFVEQGSGYYGEAGGSTGYSEDDIQRYIDSDANKALKNAGLGYNSVEEFVDATLKRSDQVASKYFDPNEWNTFTDKQKLAAIELYHQGNSDTGRTNGLSAKDIDWVKNEANAFKGIVASPNTQAISTGFDPVVNQAPVVQKPRVPSIDTSVAGGGFTPTTPETDVLELGSGEVAPIDPNRPQTVTQQVAPVTYQDNTKTVAPVQSGTVSQPLQTAGLSAVPSQVTYKTHYAGTQGAVPQTLVSTVPGMGTTYDVNQAGYRTVTYGNALGQRIPITELNGQPVTYVPPGFMRLDQLEAQQSFSAQQSQNNQSQNYQSGGGRGTGSTPYSGPMSGGPMSGNPNASRPSLSQLSPDQRLVIGPDGWYVEAYTEPNTFGTALGSLLPNSNRGMFGFAEGGDTGSRENEALYTIAKMNGYNGPKSGTALKAFFNSSDALKAKARAIGVAMNKGGAVLYADGGVDVSEPPVEEETPFREQQAEMAKNLISQTMQPIQPTVTGIQPTSDEFIPVDAGMTTPVAPYAEAATVGTVQQAEMPTETAASTYDASTAAEGVKAETDALQAQTGVVSEGAQVTAETQDTTLVSDLKAEQGTAIMMDNPVQREIQDGELISGAANAEKAAEFTEQIEAATATPSEKATVQGQLEGLMQQFEGGNTPAWAAGSMRTAMQTLAARGLGASSLAGQAVIQAAMEAALPIAQMDAQTQAQFESQNLSNRQQRAMLAAQQRAQFLGQEFDQEFQSRVANSARIGDIANMNFTAEQQVALENARAANTMELNNLSNRQALVMAEAAALANLDMANLNNRQQAAVQNAQSFLQMDMANLNNEQQTAIFKAQQNIQALFTDQAAENAALQFNASSENQTNQFFANLASQTSQFNATQQNAMDQFNVNSVNALREFNSELQQQRDLFNAQNGLVIAQANAQWRQNIATINTAAQNESNMTFAKTMNAFTATNLDAYWQRERDTMAFAFTSAENAADRLSSVLLEKLSADNKAALADEMGKGSLTATLLKGTLNYMAGKAFFI